MPIVKRTPLAKQDLLAHVLYLAKINSELAERFIEATELAFEGLARMPLKGQLQEFKSPELANTRRWFVPGFDRNGELEGWHKPLVSTMGIRHPSSLV